MNIFKYQDVAKVGDRIRAYDFAGNTDCFIEGIVLRKDDKGKEQGFAAFIIEVDRDNSSSANSSSANRIGSHAWVPMEIAIFDWETRVIKV